MFIKNLRYFGYLNCSSSVNTELHSGQNSSSETNETCSFLIDWRSFMSSYSTLVISFLQFRSSSFGGANSCFWASSCIFASHCLTEWFLTPVPKTPFDLECYQYFLVLILPLTFHCHKDHCVTIIEPKCS